MFMMIEVRLLRYFVAVADELHFGRAAQALHLAPQPLSQAIKRLEDQLGVVLFRRTSRKVELTLPGEVFYARSKHLLQQLDEAIELTRKVAEGGAGTLSIGYLPSAVPEVLPTFLRACQALPHLELQLHELTVRDLLSRIQKGQLDAGIVTAVGLPEGLQHLDLQQHSLALAVPKGHPLAEHAVVSRKSAQQVPLIGYDWQHCPELQALLDEVVPVGHRTHDFVQKVMSEQSALALVQAGMGAAVVTRGQQQHAPASVSFLDFDPPVQCTFQLVWKAGNHPALKGLIQMLQEHLNIQHPN